MIRLTSGWRGRAVLVLALVAPLAACGKKGPPQAPFLRLPAPVNQFAARRLGSTVYLKFAIPTANKDNSTPADVSRVEVYGFTGSTATDEEMVRYGTLVATVPVRRPPSPDEEEQAPRKPGTAKEPAVKPPERKPKEPEPGFDQGATVTVTETLTQPLLQPAVVKRRAQPKKAVRSEPPILLPVASFAEMPARFYVAVAVNHKGQRGVFSPHVAVPLADPPAAPSKVTVTYTESAITLTWIPPAGAPFPPVAAVPDPENPTLTARPIVPSGTPAWSYDVFDMTPAKPPDTGGTSNDGAPARPPLPHADAPTPLNPQPLNATSFTDSRIEFGTERCYALRTLNVFGTMQEASDPSEVVCVTPRDTFPPAAPKGLIAVAGAGAISLNWEPNTEKDLGGYLVLRGEAPGTSLQPLTAAPITDTTYEDKTVQPGVRYVYAIVAVDKATPPNVSAQSNRIEETAR